MLYPITAFAFVIPFFGPNRRHQSRSCSSSLVEKKAAASAGSQKSSTPITVELDVNLNDAKITDLFAWVSRAFAGDARYNNLMLAIAAVFGKNVPPESLLVQMVQEARQQLPADDDDDEEEALLGQALSQYEREQASLGAMGAAQWLGQWKTRPHALLSVQNLTNVEQWERTLPRGCRRTLKRAVQQQQQENFTVFSKPIRNNAPAPHSSLAHFRCVVEHEVRLLSAGQDEEKDPEAFLDALAVAISRYIGTTQMAGQIQEYRDKATNRIIGFAHEVQKGNTVRGQWFYVTDDASKRYVWFHSVRSLVERAIASDQVTVVDLGPSGSDSFSELKAKYGFVSVDDWPSVANYKGPFWNYEKQEPARNGVTY